MVKSICRRICSIFPILVISVHLASAQSDEYTEFNYGQDTGGENWIQSIRVSSPAYRSEIRGDVPIQFKASGMEHASAFCWQQPTSQFPNPWGHDQNLSPDGIRLDAGGNGSFVFRADQFPNGPINIRIMAENAAGKRDVCELQLFNTGGVKWNQGIPNNIPDPALGMELIFADDFDQSPSISNDGRNATYMAHKPRFGDFSGWPFSDDLEDGEPFSQTGTWLKIAARKDSRSPQGRTGLIASVNMDGKGIWAKAPCYLECRFTAQSAIGTWPAFWTITHLDPGTRGDELDIVEAYGGVGKGNPNHPGYSIVGHFWGQFNADGSKKEHPNTVAKIMELGGKSYWSTTFHTYGCKIDLQDTIYYFDNIEVFRHPTGEISKQYPHCFLINYAIGGISGWKIDLSRYQEGSDMWIDYVRVFAKNPVPDYTMAPPGTIPGLITQAIGLNFSVNDDESTILKSTDLTGEPMVSQRNWNNLTGAKGSVDHAIDDQGQPTPTKLEWKVPAGDNDWRSKTGRDWGFKNENLKLQKGYIQAGGTLTIQNIPYKKYQVYVYLGADDNGGKGKVTLTSNSSSSKTSKDCYYQLGWVDGRFSQSGGISPEQATIGNFVIFPDNTSKDIQIDWRGDLEGGWTGVTGLQIIAIP
ncbi:family 16 glycosylhydrolase [Luteolibacter pohnpeiensis]|uniref:Family 16 glycosylhydrolase n=1 Tax=Luteolibacter pohnpeiensis TaxID=454153 RepID=A0A934S4B1_9BACT|nr:family 16 glycosylhydrolase [Luteolibacter pohnpeiensis]MBK1880950.1 family 16 glycosylhydrolase [Luteolibacter pohnpeiensis]